MSSLLSLALAASAFAAAPVSAQQTDQMAPPPGAMRDGGMGHGGGPGRGMGGGGMVAALMRADTNGDGIITREEAIASSDAMFDRLDANHDGVLTPDEMQAARGAMRRGGTPPSGDMGATPAPPPPAGAAPMGMTRQQWHDRALRQFDRLDGNHDGKVDRTEIANYQSLMRERRMERRNNQSGGDMPPPPPPAPSGQQ